jgi:hypothetical protein
VRRDVAAGLVLVDHQHARRLAQYVSRASSAVIGFSNSMFTASEWPMNTGTLLNTRFLAAWYESIFGNTTLER